mmetsp:Transcript_12549/g.29969  ORF Transcript_12549/g.29969 Transcript_12549/m.29969 type:complete len:232 (+) Transcript_12549:1026-1721(+)
MDLKETQDSKASSQITFREPGRNSTSIKAPQPLKQPSHMVCRDDGRQTLTRLEHDAKAQLPISNNPSANETSVRLWQYRKALDPIRPSLDGEGMEIVFRLEHASNANSSISCNSESFQSFSSVKELHQRNALFPIVSTVEGRCPSSLNADNAQHGPNAKSLMTLSPSDRCGITSDWQFRKTLSSIRSTDGGIWICFKETHDAKAPLPMYLSLDDKVGVVSIVPLLESSVLR